MSDEFTPTSWLNDPYPEIGAAKPYCPNCGGCGKVYNSPLPDHTCTDCGGTGVKAGFVPNALTFELWPKWSPFSEMEERCAE